MGVWFFRHIFRMTMCVLVVGIVLVFFFEKGSALVSTGLPSIRQFILLGADYDALRNKDPLTKIVLQIKKILPAAACVESSFPKERGSYYRVVSFKYALFPAKVKDYWPSEFNRFDYSCRVQYFIDFDHFIKAIPLGWKSYGVGSGVRVFALPGAEFQAVQPDRGNSQAVIFVTFLFFNFIIFIIGSFLFCAFFVQNNTLPLAAKLGASFLTGMLAVTFIFVGLALAQVPLSFILVISVMVACLLGSYLFMKLQRGNLWKIFCVGHAPFNVSDMPYVFAGFCVIAFYCGLIVSQPVNSWDELSVWLLKAKMFYAQGNITSDYTEYFFNYYPVFWPLNIAIQYIFIGGDHDEVAKWTSALVFLSSMALLRGLADSLGLTRKASWITIVVFLIIGYYWTYATALPENIFIALVSFATVFFIKWLNSREIGLLWVCSLALCGVAMVKFEGFVISALFLVSFFFVDRPSLNNIWKFILKMWPLGLAFIVHAVWLFWLKFNHISYTVFHLQGNFSFENVLSLIRMLTAFVFQAQNILFIYAVLMISIVLRIWKGWGEKEFFLFFLCFGMIIFALSAGMLWSNNDFVLYYPEVLARLFSRVMPFLTIFWMACIFKKKSGFLRKRFF